MSPSALSRIVKSPRARGDGSFWDQAASAAHGETAGLSTSASAFSAIAGLSQAATTATETSAHDFLSALDASAHTAELVGGTTHDAGFAAVGFNHAELGTATLHNGLNVGGLPTRCTSEHPNVTKAAADCVFPDSLVFGLKEPHSWQFEAFAVRRAAGYSAARERRFE